jgi:DNA-binding transcriptional LysR family regulator
VTQPSLSKGIKELEHELGAPIFLRGRGLRFKGLTAEGERIAAWSRGVLAYCEAMRKEISMLKSGHVGNLRLGATPSLSPILPSILQLFRSQYPDARVDVQFIGDDAMKAGLGNFIFDIAIGYLDEKEASRRHSLPIYREGLSLLVPDSPQFKKYKKITWREAAQLPLAMLRPSMQERLFVDRIFKNLGCSPTAQLESESILHLMLQSQFTELCTIIPSHFESLSATFSRTRVLPLVEPVVMRDVGVLWAQSDILLPMANAFVSLMKKLDRSGELKKIVESSFHKTCSA